MRPRPGACRGRFEPTGVEGDMRWRSGRRSAKVLDARGSRPRRKGGMALGGGGVIIALGLAYFLGIDPGLVLALLGGGDVQMPGTRVEQSAAPSPGAELADFVSVVLADTEDTWAALFASQGARYAPPTLVLFTEAVDSACGMAGAAVGPFYCPADQRIYIDLSFYRELRNKYGAPGDFAQAYVLAHEVGHHVQNLVGTMGEVNRVRRGGSQDQANALSVRVELQADCYAGVWAHHADRARSILEAGDVDEAMRAASAVGDDTIQRRSRGYVVPDSFTHGSAEQRMQWFALGLETGSIERCNTFAASGTVSGF